MAMRRRSAGTPPGTVIVMAAVAVALLILPGGVWAGLVLAILAAIVTGVNPRLRSRRELWLAVGLALVVTGGGLILTLT